VSTRALSRRPYFEVPEDYRFMLAKMREAVEDQRIEVHGYCLMTNHLHSVVCSLDGNLSATMRDILGPFSRWFNARRGRDGPLVKSRFFSRSLDEPVDQYVAMRYVDRNPVMAGMTRTVIDYEHGSARHFAFGTGPSWLSRSEVEATVRAVANSNVCDPASYLKAFGMPVPTSLDWLVEQRLRSGTNGMDSLGELLVSSKIEIQDWLVEAARLADGSPIGYSLAQPDSLLETIASLRQLEPDWTCQPNRRTRSAWTILSAGLLRGASHETLSEISRRLGIGRGTVERQIRDHRILMESDEEYAHRAAAILHRELRDLVPGYYLRKRTVLPVGKISHGEDCTTW
jgi:REP element-mobilizing transposase RayT